MRFSQERRRITGSCNGPHHKSNFLAVMFGIEILAVILSIFLVLMFGLLRARQHRLLKWLVAAVVANAASLSVGILGLERGEDTIVPTLYVVLLAAITGAGLVICSIARVMNWCSKRRADRFKPQDRTHR